MRVFDLDGVVCFYGEAGGGGQRMLRGCWWDGGGGVDGRRRKLIDVYISLVSPSTENTWNMEVATMRNVAAKGSQTFSLS